MATMVLAQVSLGSHQQGFAFAGALGGQGGVAAGDQALARVVGVGYLGQVDLVEQAHLQSARGGQGGDRRGAQAREPAEAAHFLERRDAGRGDHPPVAHHHHVGEPEALAHRLCGRDERGGVGGVAGEDLHCHRAAFGVAGEPVLDLGFPRFAVAGVAPAGQRATTALHPAARQVVEHPAPGGQVAPCQGHLDVALAGKEPVHGGVDVVGGRPLHPQVGPERGGGPPARRRQLGGRLACPGHHQRQGQVPLGAGRAQELGQTELPGHGADGGDVAVGQGPLDLEALTGGHQRLAGQAGPHRGDRLGGQVREVGQRLGLYLAALPVRATQQYRLVDLVLVVPTSCHHMDRTTTPSHKGILYLQP